VDLSPSDIRRRQFEQVRRGFDPQEVGVFLEQVAEIVAAREKEVASARAEVQRLERALTEARSAEEAVRLTMVAATKAKDEILSGAQGEADQVVDEARAEADAALESARREALALLEESRSDAENLVATAQREHDAVMTEVTTLRDVIRKASNVLKGMASGALAEIAHAEALLGNDAAAASVAARADSAGDALDPVDRLLEQLRASEG
jgi:DivIVA domain-containing protein